MTVVLYLGLALLAGAALSALGERNDRSIAVALLPVVAALFLVTRAGSASSDTLADFFGAGGWGGRTRFLLENGIPVPDAALITVLAGLALVAAYALLPAGRGFVAALLVAVMFVDLLSAGRSMIEARETADGGGAIRKLDLSVYYGPRTGAAFLRSRAEGEPARYFGYDYVGNDTVMVAYATRFTDPRVKALLVNNAASHYGVQDVQGYDAIHLARYDEYMAALNERTQNRHFSNVVPEGLESPLLDLLNVRYVVTPAATGPEPGSPCGVSRTTSRPPTRTNGLQILENRDALPRAWIVHSARQTTPEEALKLLGSGDVDPRQTALLERSPPDLASPDDASSDRASVSSYEAGRVRVSATTGAPGLLVLSEVYYPAWKAYVDGEPAPIYRANHLLRAVPIPAGDHTVELRYESWPLRAGIAISLIALAVLVGLVIVRVRESFAGKKRTSARVEVPGP